MVGKCPNGQLLKYNAPAAPAQKNNEDNCNSYKAPKSIDKNYRYNITTILFFARRICIIPIVQREIMKKEKEALPFAAEYVTIIGGIAIPKSMIEVFYEFYI